MAESLPICFGLRWDAGTVECAGGLDPSFPGNKLNRCPYFTQCASKTAANKLGQVGQVPPVPITPKPVFPVHSQQPQQLFQVRPSQQQQAYQQPQPQQQYQIQPQPVQQQLVPPQQAQVPYMVPMNFAPAYSQMPGYLTVPEPIVPGQHWGKRLGWSVMRSMLKAGGHTVANFFDHNPMQMWYPPQQ